MYESSPGEKTTLVRSPAVLPSLVRVAGSVTVRGSERSDLRITGTLGKGTEGLTVEGDSQRLQIEVDYPNSSGWGGWWGGGRVTDSELVIELPRGAIHCSSTVRSPAVNCQQPVSQASCSIPSGRAAMAAIPTARKSGAAARRRTTFALMGGRVMAERR